MRDIGYEIVGEEYGGKRINLFSSYSVDIQRVIDKENITSILLSQREGWGSQSIDFLLNIKGLKCLYLYDDAITDISIIEELRELEVLYLECLKVKKAPDFLNMTKLKDVRVDWRACFKTLHSNATVETLLINGYKCHDFSDFTPSLRLKRLEVQKGGIKTLLGLEKFKNIKKLSLYQCSKLESISSLLDTFVEEIDFETCKNIKDLEVITELTSLKSIALDKCGVINSILGISKLKKLKNIVLSDTIINDGDLSELIAFKHINIYFDNKKHYSHKLSEVRASINDD